MGRTSAERIRELSNEFQDVWLDLGTGDGRFVLRQARERPTTLVVGVDTREEATARSARLAGRSTKKGGLPNALFLVASLEDLPPELRGLADNVSVAYPWGSLMRSLALPDPEALVGLVELLAPGGSLHVLLNASAASDGDYAVRQQLPPLTGEHVEQQIVPGWRSAGLEVVGWRFLEPGEAPRFRTTWGQRLVLGSARETIDLTARRA